MIRTAAHIITTTATRTSTGTRIATNTSTTLATSSSVLSTGAAVPAVATLAAGRTVDFVSDTISATATPTATGTHCPDWAKAPGSATADVWAAVTGNARYQNVSNGWLIRGVSRQAAELLAYARSTVWVFVGLETGVAES